MYLMTWMQFISVEKWPYRFISFIHLSEVHRLTCALILEGQQQRHNILNYKFSHEDECEPWNAPEFPDWNVQWAVRPLLSHKQCSLLPSSHPCPPMKCPQIIKRRRKQRRRLCVGRSDPHAEFRTEKHHEREKDCDQSDEARLLLVELCHGVEKCNLHSAGRNHGVRD